MFFLASFDGPQPFGMFSFDALSKKKERDRYRERERERERERKSEDDGGPIFLREEKSEQKPGRDCR